ncbi:TM2 domain-containing protein [Marinilactibacillus sp. Marseille-P9653]|uniref:TM2 domain-containing protein n=1 Tax=Marinilactibacillus sp. Marseille-P9653 TaxID=2866583 RepID=UPI001CE4505F|nr:TM2 domain-containing protein [Marinilactibacillus sp. Marseille-P9653]
MYEQLTNEEKMVVNSEVANSKKSTGMAYLLWFFLGVFGIHRFYLNRKGSAIALLALFVTGWITSVILIGFLFLFIGGIWLFVDLFLVAGMVRVENEKLTTSFSQKIYNRRNGMEF